MQNELDRFGSDRSGRSPHGPKDERVHGAVSFRCMYYPVRLCREQLLLAWQCRRSVLGTCRLADAAGLQREGLSCRTQDGFVAEHSAFYSCTQETDGTVDVPGIAKSIRRRNRSLPAADVFHGSRGEVSGTLSCMQLVGHTFAQNCQHCVRGGGCRCTRARSGSWRWRREATRYRNGASRARGRARLHVH